MATAPSPNDLTRQQLDELDALLQRMLSVPLAPADTPMPAPASRAEGPPLPPSWRVDPPAPAAGASAPHIALPEPPPAVLKFEAPPAPPPAAPPAPKPTAAAPTPKAAPKPAPLPPAAPVTPSKPQAAAAPAAPAMPVPLLLLPLVAFNGLFDGICGMFGPPGRLLRSAFFKHIYGLVGLGLLAYTAAHIAKEQGLLTLPFPLPWPR